MRTVARKEGLEPLKFFFCRQSECKGAGLSFFQQWQQTQPALLRSPCRRDLGMKDYTHSHTDAQQVFLMGFPCGVLLSACCRALEVLGAMTSPNNRQAGSCRNAQHKIMLIFFSTVLPLLLGNGLSKELRDFEADPRTNVLNSAICCLPSITGVPLLLYTCVSGEHCDSL